ncbi:MULTISPECIES: MBL fold metallo-hydrolase [unclassified Paenibacillus]|uniref:ComEC/Rec2 family competence protein n=1 Tax=unclassified Paenibacillus TaxID=185978 RepID=UPI000953C958|nr:MULTISPECIES: MBL fold metallo-hydrolase [unclassified Paenibacillus]ASS65436.2 MBL fold metallo-hydrolase [Paenibacillus sp. RUD330]SIQ36301.1 competence protein ComEC [Paenibacillus sp. RU4X]SIQ58336.1 competence protein ComEC [Paenibacillus sp. RU4T]
MPLPTAVHFLNVGWGDAHLILTPSGSVTLIDGGDSLQAPCRDHPLSWMKRQRIGRLDWMILTHLHEDHLNGLLDVARSLPVVHAVLPYEIPDLHPDAAASMTGRRIEESPQALRVSGILAGYRELVRLLREQGTRIRWRSDYSSAGSSTVWEEGPCRLVHLYPWLGDPLPGLEVLAEASREGNLSAEDALEKLELFFDRSNDDSSVYRLEEAGAEGQGVLFGGDLLAAGWERLSERMELKCSVLKVPHHGLEDAFGELLLSAALPAHAVIPISIARSEPLEGRWNGLCSPLGVAVHLTGATAPMEKKRLTSGSIEAWIGG